MLRYKISNGQLSWSKNLVLRSILLVLLLNVDAPTNARHVAERLKPDRKFVSCDYWPLVSSHDRKQPSSFTVALQCQSLCSNCCQDWPSKPTTLLRKTASLGPLHGESVTVITLLTRYIVYTQYDVVMVIIFIALYRAQVRNNSLIILFTDFEHRSCNQYWMW